MQYCHTDNSDRCAAVFINKGVTVDLEQDTVTVEFAGTGPGMLPQDTVNEFSCIFNGNNDPGPRDCKSIIKIHRVCTFFKHCS